MRRRARTLAPLSLFALLVAALPVRAQPARPRVVAVTVGTDALSQVEAARLSYHAERALLRSGRFDVVRLTDALDPPGARTRQARLNDAESAYESGLQAYEALDTQKAVQLFDKAVKAYEQTDLSRTFGALVKAWTMRIACHVANGDNRVARAEVDRLLPVSPKAEFSSRFFPPEEIAYVEKVRRTIAALSTSSVTVKTAPAPGAVFLDGVFRGVSPAAVNKIPPADHFVTVLAPGYVLQQERVRDGVADVVVKPASDFSPFQDYRKRIAGAPRSKGRDEAARELGQWLGVNQVLVTVLTKSPAGDALEAIALRLDVSDGHNVAFEEKALPLGPSLDVVAEQLYDGLTASDEARSGGPVTHYGSSAGWTRRSTGYVLMGAGLALAGGALFSGLRAQEEHRLFLLTPQVDQTVSAQRRQSGQAFALLTDVFAITGVIAAGTGGYLAFLSTPGGGAAKPDEPATAPAPEQPRPRPSDDLREE